MDILKDIPLLKKIVDLGQAMVIVILLSALVGLILALPVMFLWNFVFGSYLKINWLQAWALNILTGILFGQRNSK